MKTSVSPTKPVVYRLEVAKLSEIQVAGSTTVQIRSLNTDSLKVDGSGATTFTVSGQTGLQEVTFSGAGEYRARDLKSREARIAITGSGDAVVSVSDKLDVNVTGAGSIEYIGDPVVSKSVTGAGSIRKVS
jgi:hypothetical protein